MTGKNEMLIQQLSELSVLELVNLVKSLEEAWGVSAAAPVMVAGGGAAAPAAEEKNNFDVKLAGGVTAENKIATIKLLRTTISGLELQPAKEMAENLPKVIKEGVDKAEAEKLKKDFEAIGIKVELV